MGLSVFQCEECGNVDLDLTPDNSATLCTRCSTGDWHGVFEEEKYNAEVHEPVDEEPL